MASSDLKRLAVVRSLAERALTTGEGLYRTARGFVPAAAEPLVSQLEAKAAPVVTLAQDKAADLLAAVDAKVDAVLSSTLDVHAKNMGSFSAAKETYASAIEGVVDRLKAGLSQLGAAVVAVAVAVTDPDRFVDLAARLYDRVATRQPVSSALQLADPFITRGQEQYAKAHDLIVMQPLYKRVYDTAAGLPAKAAPLKDTGLYRLAAPVADPVLANIANSKVFKQLDDHLKPKAA